MMQTLRLRASRQSDERGIVLVWFALCLTVMLLGSAFAVDVGAWYKRSQELQRAADAAAMAAVSYLPVNVAADLTNAQNAAYSALKANGVNYGFANGSSVAGGDPNISVTVGVSATSSRQFQVTVVDSAVPQYFSKLAFNGVTQTRTATAEIIPTAPLGSPLNNYGMGTLTGGSNHNIWAEVAGWCTPKEGGDRYLSRYDGTYSATGPSWACPTPYQSSPGAPATSNSEFDGLGYHGYDYVIDVPTGRATPVQVNVYDPAYVPFTYNGFGQFLQCGSPDQYYNNASYDLQTTFDLYNPAGTLISHKVYSSTETGPGVTGHGNLTYCKQWDTISPAGGLTTAGKYRLNVYTTAGQANSAGINAFSIEAIDQGAAHQTTCSSSVITGITYSATCPNVYAKDATAVYATADRSNGNGQGGMFYLAKVDGSHKGGTMTVTLWDPGEGGRYIQIIDNNGNDVTFNYAVSPCASNCSGTVSSGTNGLAVSGTVTPPAGFQGNGTYNDKLLTLTVSIPANYDATNNGGWWQINYNLGNGSSVSDTTTWSVRINGSPIHLIKGG